MPAETGRGPQRRLFGPVVLAGLGGGGLATAAAARLWFGFDPPSGSPQAVGLAEGGQAPAAVSLGLVCLAAWGALLVTRGRVRVAMAVLAALAAAAVLAAWVAAWGSVPDSLVADAAAQGIAGGDTHPTPWYFLSGLGAAVALAAAVVAVRLAPRWPEMGRRYDAPGGAGETTGGAEHGEETSGRDLWRALDEGRDPTADPE